MKMRTFAEKLYDLKRVTFIRVLAWPVINSRRVISRFLFRFSEHANRLRMLKNKNINQRCFVIGNGPSLRVADLNKLENEKTFATNRIYSIFSETDWRPTYYFCSDVDLMRIEGSNIINNAKEINFLESKAKRFLNEISKDNTLYFTEKFHHYIKWYTPQRFEISEDISKYFSVSGTIVLHAVQMAIYMGFKEIYLLGVDHNYSHQIDANGKMHISKVKNYFKGIKDYSFSVYNIGSVEYGYRVAKNYCERNGIVIKNATRGGKLEIFERIDFDSLMSEMK